MARRLGGRPPKRHFQDRDAIGDDSDVVMLPVNAEEKSCSSSRLSVFGRGNSSEKVEPRLSSLWSSIRPPQLWSN
jgi:hypothetical protein